MFGIDKNAIIREVKEALRDELLRDSGFKEELKDLLDIKVLEEKIYKKNDIIHIHGDGVKIEVKQK